MGVILCPDCMKEISESAELCPHCGGKVSAEYRKKALVARGKQAKMTWVVLGVLAVCIVVYVIVASI